MSDATTSALLTLEDFLPRQRGGDVRAWMNKPFTLGDGFAYATDGRILARRAATEREAKELEIVPDQRATGFFISRILEDALNNPTTHTAPEVSGFGVCTHCHGTGHVPEKLCPDCDGVGGFDRGNYTYECKRCETTGWVVCEQSDPAHQMHRCFACGGTGLEIHERKAATTHGVRLSLRYLHRIQGATLYIANPHETVGWRLGNFDGALMPLKP